MRMNIIMNLRSFLSKFICSSFSFIRHFILLFMISHPKYFGAHSECQRMFVKGRMKKHENTPLFKVMNLKEFNCRLQHRQFHLLHFGAHQGLIYSRSCSFEIISCFSFDCLTVGFSYCALSTNSQHSESNKKSSKNDYSF